MRKNFFLLLLFASSASYAQFNKEDKRLAIGVYGGIAMMQGDGNTGDLSLCGGSSLKYSLANNFSVRALFITGSIVSVNLGESTIPPYQYKAATTFYESNIQALLNIVNFKKTSTGRNIAQMYVGIGVGYTFADISYDPGIPATEYTSVQTMIMPFTVGLRFYINPLIDLGFEYTSNLTFNDHFDGFSPSGFSNKANDFYNITKAYISFNIGKNNTARNIEWTEQTEKLYEELIKAKKEAQIQIEELKKKNEELIAAMKVELKTQMHDNQHKADSTMKIMKKVIINDSDSDGVSNIFDKEPESPLGAIVDGSGRTVDTDRDGVPDFLDKCPIVPGKVLNHGCPIEPTQSQLEIVKNVKRTLQFETGLAIIKPSSFPALDELVYMLLDNPSYNFRIEGHTDNVGNQQSNLELSIRRAEAVKEYITKNGIDASRIISNGYGDTKPLVSNETATGRAKNRRVDMTIE